MKMCLARAAFLALALPPFFAAFPAAGKTTITVQAGAPGKAISPDLFGIFFEDLNYAADGGLYAELVQNRSFEYHVTANRNWHNLTSWDLVNRAGKGAVAIDAAFPLHPNNPHYAVVEISQPGDVALVNPDFDGIPVQTGERYDLSLFIRQLYVGGRWDSEKQAGALPLVARLETRDGDVLGETAFEVTLPEWRRCTATITPSLTVPEARLVLVAKDRGGIALDEISLFPRKTFRNRPNGLRADLAEVIADLKPKFVRFPDGCLVHGNGLGNMYRWKDTIGPVEQRRQQSNLWSYHQTVGLGYYEYFQFCEDIGAKPVPVVAASVCCQNSGHTGGTGQQGLPLEQMPDYIQEVLDLIEWANGPVTSEWGAKRAAAGHPEPFGLQYLGVGNEDRITPVFRERFEMIYNAVKAKHPEITVIGTVGPFPEGEDFDTGWKIADDLRVPMVDEHYYMSPQWFLDNLSRYDSYDRTRSGVYLGEYAAHDDARRTTLRSALAEAAYLTGLERNGDIVRMASYAPLLAKIGHTQWNPDLIYFTNTVIFPTINYHVQKLFGTNAGDTWLPAKIAGTAEAESAALAFSAVRDGTSADLILKIVNPGPAPQSLRIELDGARHLAAEAARTVLAGDPLAVNDRETPDAVVPVTSKIPVGPAFDCESLAHSLTVLRIAAQTPKPSR